MSYSNYSNYLKLYSSVDSLKANEFIEYHDLSTLESY